jgi:Zn-finger nucleic acid-binding protein
MDCPRCGAQLRQRRLGSVAFRRCPSCGGSWYGADKLRILKDKAAHGDYRWIHIDLWKERKKFRAGKQERIACPKDGHTMVSVRYGDSRIRVDICERCRGIWLDAKEFAKILRYLEEQVDSETIAGYLSDLRNEFADALTHPSHAASDLADMAKVLHLLELRFIVQHAGIATALRSASRGVPGA